MFDFENQPVSYVFYTVGCPPWTIEDDERLFSLNKQDNFDYLMKKYGIFELFKRKKYYVNTN